MFKPFLVILLCIAPSLSYRDIDLRNFSIEGDSLFRLKYRVRYVGENGIVDSAYVIKYKGRNIRATDTTGRRVRMVDSLIEE